MDVDVKMIHDEINPTVHCWNQLDGTPSLFSILHVETVVPSILGIADTRAYNIAASPAFFFFLPPARLFDLSICVSLSASFFSLSASRQLPASFSMLIAHARLCMHSVDVDQ